MSLVIGQACLDHTARRVQERTQFGKPIIDFQLVQAALADMIIEVTAARHLIEDAAAVAGRGATTAIDASIAKCYPNEMARRVGGYGYSVEYESASRASILGGVSISEPEPNASGTPNDGRMDGPHANSPSRIQTTSAAKSFP
jgi:butyryl-CoA dehydrogenase